MRRGRSDNHADEVGDSRQASARNVSAARALTALLPLVVVLVAVGALVWWLLDRGSAAAPWLVAAILFAHGWVHLVFLLPATERRKEDEDGGNPFDMDRSWLVERGVDNRPLRRVGVVLAAVTFVTLAAAGLAVLGWLVPTGWWISLVTAGVIGSTALLVLFFAPALVLGFAINAGLLALTIQTTWEVRR